MNHSARSWSLLRKSKEKHKAKRTGAKVRTEVEKETKTT